MILVDTSVWVDHLRNTNPRMAGLLDQSAVLMHPCVVGELACGSLEDRAFILETLLSMPAAEVAEPDEVLGLIERRALHGRGIGYVDAHLLVSAVLSHAKLWTLDKRLAAAALQCGCAYTANDAH